MGEQGALDAAQMALLAQPDFSKVRNLRTGLQSALGGPNPADDAWARDLRAFMGADPTARPFLEQCLDAIPTNLVEYANNKERNVWLTDHSLGIRRFRRQNLT